MKVKSFFRKKSMSSISSAKNELDRTLSTFQLIMLGIGAIVGAGIFVIIGPAAGGHAGPAVTLSFILAALGCACAGLCYAELASSIPVSGSAYSYLYVAVGEVVAWLVAWTIFLTYFMGAATVASGWSSYLVSLLGDFGIHFPRQLAENYGASVTLADGSAGTAIIDIPAILLILAITYVLYVGTSTSAIVNTVLVSVKMAILALFLIIGITKVDITNWVPYIPENTGTFGEFGFSGIIAGAALVLFAYSGFDAVATASQEAKDPQRSVPRGILGSLAVAAITYIAIAAVLTGVVGYQALNSGQPIATAVDLMGIPWFKLLMKIGIVIGLPSVILVEIYAIVRIFYSMTKDGLLPPKIGVVSKKTHTPHILTFMVGGLMAITTAFIPLESLAKISNFGGAMTLILVCFATVYLHYTRPDIKRVFKTPLMPYVPIFGIVLFTQIILSLSNSVLVFGFLWAVVLVVLYMLYGNRKSVLRDA